MRMLQVNFIMVYIIHKITRIFKRFFRRIIEFFWKKKKGSTFSQDIMVESSSFEKEYIIKDVTNLLKLKKEADDITIKDIRNLFRLKNKIK